MTAVIGMIDEFFNFNLLLTFVCTQHVNKFNWFQASLLEREWVLSQLSKLIWLEIDRHLPDGEREEGLRERGGREGDIGKNEGVAWWLELIMHRSKESKNKNNSSNS